MNGATGRPRPHPRPRPRPPPRPAPDAGGRAAPRARPSRHGHADPPPAGPLVQAQGRLGPHRGQQPATAARGGPRHRVQQRRAETAAVRLRGDRQLVHLQRPAEPRPRTQGAESLGDLPVAPVGRKDLRGDPGRGETRYRPSGRRHRRREPGPERVPREPFRVDVGPRRILVPGRGREGARVHVADAVGVPEHLTGLHRSYLARHRTVPRSSVADHRRNTGRSPVPRGNPRARHGRRRHRPVGRARRPGRRGVPAVRRGVRRPRTRPDRRGLQRGRRTPDLVVGGGATATGPTGQGGYGFNQGTPDVVGPWRRTTGSARGGVAARPERRRPHRARRGRAGRERGRGLLWVFPATASGPAAKGSFSFGHGTLGTVATKAGLGSSFNR